jgi:syntaxin-binding protein 1
MRTLQAVYLISPSDESIDALIDDFKDPKNPKYKKAHVFFTEGKKVENLPFKLSQRSIFFLLAIPDNLFEKLKGKKVVKFMETCKEINIAFMPYESQVQE